MRIRLGLFGSILGAALFAGSAANATPTLVGTTTDPTGVNNLLVDGTNYDVTFSLTALNSFTAGSTLSVDASNALASALNTLNVTELGNVSLTAEGLYQLDVDNSLNIFDAAGLGIPFGPLWVNVGDTGSFTLGVFGADYIEAADFSEASNSVPEPLTISLFGAGLAGAAVLRRRRKKTLATKA